MELSKAIQKRHSVRKFTDKKPDWREIIECIDSSRYASMAGNNFTLRFILVDDSDSVEKIAEASEQDFISQVKFIVVACSKIDRTTNAFGERGEIYCRQQAGAGIQNLILSLIDKGLSTCWIGHFNEEKIKSILKIPEDVNIEAIFPIGYELEKNPKLKNKTALDNVLFFNQYKNKYMRKIKKLEG
jgi:nitroreductase